MAAIQQQNQLLMQLLSQQRNGNGGQQAQPQPTLLPFPDQFPEKGTVEEQDRWRFRKEAWDTAQQQWPKVLQAYDQYRAPIDTAVLGLLRDREWDKVSGKLDRWGIERQEVQPLVDQAMQDPRNRDRSLGAVLNDIADALGFDDAHAGGGEPQVPNVQRPGAGRSTIPTTPTAKPKAPTMAQQALARAKAAAVSGNRFEADVALRDYFRSGAVQIHRK